VTELSLADIESSFMRMSWRWDRQRIGATILVMAAAMIGLAIFVLHRERSALALARQEIQARRYEDGARRLKSLFKIGIDHGEAEYLLGVCQSAMGRYDAALASWGRVPRRSPYALSAALERGKLALDQGRFVLAEDVLSSASGQTGSEADSARSLFVELLWREGRDNEALTLLENDGAGSIRLIVGSPARMVDRLRSHIQIRLFPAPIARLASLLATAAERAPDDDRVWLARANLAIHTGRLDEAEALIDAGLRRRTKDLALWRARLEWAVAGGHTEPARQALNHLPADEFSVASVEELRAWFAAQRGDTDMQRRALDHALEAEPARINLLERRAELALREGQTELAGSLRGRKASLDHALNRFRDLYVEHQGNLAQVAPAMAELAHTLGSEFEARALGTLALGQRPGDPDLTTRLADWKHLASARATTKGQTLADLLADSVASLRSLSCATKMISVAPGVIPQFRDDGRLAGLNFTFDNGTSSSHQLPESGSGGVGLLDYDGDGWLDVYAVQGGRFPPRVDSPGTGDRLFRNQGNGTFEDVTRASGIAGMVLGYGHGVTVGDYDNDGRPDLFITRWRAYALYHNRGDGTFEDATATSGLGGDRDWPTSAAFADLDNDGDLDLYVCHYLRWDVQRPRLCRSPASSGFVTCMPRLFEALPDHVFRNDGGHFRDVTAEAGVVDHDGRGLGVVAADLDDDGRVDLFVANDMSANLLFHNLGGFSFEEVAHPWGAAANADGGYQAGMGTACGDLDGDGRIDLAVTNFFGESTTFYQNLGGFFGDRTSAIGLAAPSRFLLGFGISMSDMNNDGWLDLLTVNGHVGDYRPEAPHTMPAQLLIGGPSGRVYDVSDRAGAPFAVPHLGRGLATGDLDNDGRLDAIAVAQNEPLVYLHNQTEVHHYLVLALEGTASNRDGVGTRIAISAGGRKQVGQRTGGGSYQSANDPRIHFGTGASTRVDTVEVRWPSGRVDLFSDLQADIGYLIREGSGHPEVLKGWKR
jgi:enediyne biosynthesis protein E4